MVKNVVFKDFSEYWHFARSLSDKQRGIVFDNLSDNEKEMLENSYLTDGWSDVICHNEINDFIDSLKEKYGYDILEIKSKALRNKSTYVPKKFWDLLIEKLNKYKKESVKFVLNGIHAVPCKDNPQIILIVSSQSHQPEKD